MNGAYHHFRDQMKHHKGRHRMPVLQMQSDFRAVQKLRFCYLCGRAFEAGDNVTRDHVPPTSMFRKEDRSIPLILPAHKTCNDREHENDELLGLLIAHIEGWPLPSEHRYMDGEAEVVDGQLFTAGHNFNVRRFIVRCVRAFHAALYREWLPREVSAFIHPPMRAGQLDGQTGLPTNDFEARLLTDAALGQHALFVATLKRNRQAGCTDKVICRNGKCIFECVWGMTLDNWCGCVFGLKIYDWQRFGELAGYTPRGCVGVYWPTSGPPTCATHQSELEFQFPNRAVLDPFGD